MTDPHVPPGVDVSRPSIARVYDYVLGGKDNFAVDRALGDQMLDVDPHMRDVFRANRAWLRRVVRWLVQAEGIDQFLDLGSGLPTAENTHEIAQRVDPDAVVVYVDNDPAVIAHGRALLADDERSFFAAGDLSDPASVLESPEVVAHLDLDRPIAVLQCLTLHFVADQAMAESIVAGYTGHVADGSYVAVTHGLTPRPGDPAGDDFAEIVKRYREQVPSFTTRSVTEIEALFAGLDLVDPGVVPMPLWWPGGPPPADLGILAYTVGGLARKP